MDRNDFKIIINVLLVIIGGTIFIGFFTNIFVKNQCLQSYSQYQPQYSLIAGCRIMQNGLLTPTDIVREIGVK